MKHLIRDFLVSLIGYAGLAWLYRTYIRRNGPLVRVLCFHDVPDAAWFRAVLQMISNEFSLITPEQFHAHEFDSTRINVLLTFDDGYQSWVDVCLPVMEEFNAKGIFFINSGLLDVATDTVVTEKYMHEQLLLTNVRQPLTWEGAGMLVSAEQTIGGHTVSHVRSSRVTNEKWNLEVKADKSTIESKLGVSLKDFAYPFGSASDITIDAIESVKYLGYLRGYSAETGFSSHRDILVPRTLLTPLQPVAQVRNWLGGAYDVWRAVVRSVYL